MGIPQFFRWLSRRYPRILLDAPKTPVDNLYLDLNGLVHPCFHPEGRKMHSIDQVFLEMFALMDRVIAFVQPRKLVYIAVDGSAPRAKLAQQRKRRFISAYERQQGVLLEYQEAASKCAQMKQEELDEENAVSGNDAPAPAIPQAYFQANNYDPPNELDYLLKDSNAITPGTPFMKRLRQALVYYVSTRQDGTIILDDCNMPGEGEHKIMNFIRAQRMSVNYDPYTTHCIYGLDADLIMLALSSHEPNFYILRDYINFDKRMKICPGCGAELNARDANPETLAHIEKCPNFKHSGEPPIAFSKTFLTVDINYFRKYLYKEFNEPSKFERVLDDFVFLCFMAGNDFLPHIACLRIDDGGILRIIYLYNTIKNYRFNADFYLTDNGRVNFAAFYLFLEALAGQERNILIRMRSGQTRRSIGQMDRKIQDLTEQLRTLQKAATTPEVEAEIEHVKQQLRDTAAHKPAICEDIKRYNQQYEEQKIDENDTTKILLHYHFFESDPASENFPAYYYADYIDQVSAACDAFLFGMAWVCAYYARGCADWAWTYTPFFAPLVVDLSNYLKANQQKFRQIVFDTKAKPLTPYQQLLAVLPPASAHLLPAALRPLMLDSNSPLRANYPNRIQCDASQAHALWAAEVRMPAVDVKALIEESEKLMVLCSAEEVEDNCFADPVILLSRQCPEIEQAIAQAAANSRELGLILNYQVFYSGFYGYLKRQWPSKGDYLAYKKRFSRITDFITERNDRGDSWYPYLPEMAVQCQRNAFRFSVRRVREDFDLSRCLVRQDILADFDNIGWDRDYEYRRREENDLWRVQ